jgi:hypothetical protein
VVGGVAVAHHDLRVRIESTQSVVPGDPDDWRVS